MKKFNIWLEQRDNLFEVETTEETRNVAQEGDVVIRALTRAGEEYIIRGAKFPKLYFADKPMSPPDKALEAEGWKMYEVRPDLRNAVVITRPIIQQALQQFPEARTRPIPQEEFFQFVNNLPKIKVQKQSHALARPANPGEVIITRVQKGKPEQFRFEAPWEGGETMPVAEDDVLIVQPDKTYRIARAEFNQTYQQPQGRI